MEKNQKLLLITDLTSASWEELSDEAAVAIRGGKTIFGKVVSAVKNAVVDQVTAPVRIVKYAAGLSEPDESSGIGSLLPLPLLVADELFSEVTIQDR